MAYESILSSRIKLPQVDGNDILKQHSLYESIRSKKAERIIRETQRHLQNHVAIIEKSEKIALSKFDQEKIAINSRRTKLIRDKLRLARRSQELRDKGLSSLADLVRHRVPGHNCQTSFTRWTPDVVPRYVRRYGLKNSSSQTRGELNTSTSAFHGIKRDNNNLESGMCNQEGLQGSPDDHHNFDGRVEKRYSKDDRCIGKHVGTLSECREQSLERKPYNQKYCHKQVNQVGISDNNNEYLNKTLEDDSCCDYVGVSILCSPWQTQNNNNCQTIKNTDEVTRAFEQTLQSTDKFLDFKTTQKVCNFTFILQLEHNGSEIDLAYLRLRERRRLLKKLQVEYDKLSQLVNAFSIQ